MTLLSSIRIATKLPLIIVSLCIAVAFAVAMLGYLEFRKAILEETRKSYEIVTEERAAALVSSLDNLGNDVSSLGQSPTVVDAIVSLNNVYGVMMDNPTTYLQQVYINENPHPQGEKDKLDQAPEAVPYNFRHAAIHPYFRNLKNSAGYYDVFLFNQNGDLIYSVEKETDFATNLIDGPYRSSGLAKALRSAQNGAAGEIYFADFAPYAPSKNEPASFLSTPVFGDDGMMVGVFAVQLPISQIATIMNNPVGLGETGELYVIGSDFTARSGSRFPGRHDALDRFPDLPQMRAAIDEDAVFFKNILGVNGSRVAAKSLSVTVFDTAWGIVGETDLSEVMQPVTAIRNKMMIVGAVGAIVVGVLGFLTAQSVTAPLARLGVGMQAVANRKYDAEIDDTDRRDEIGVLAQTLVAFRDALRDAAIASDDRRALQKEQAKVVERLSMALRKLAEGDLTTKIETPFDGEYDALRLDYNRSIDTLNETIGSVVDRAHGIQRGSDKMTKSADELSQRTENQAATLEQTAAALDELTVSVKSAATGAREVEKIVADAQTDADESEPVVRDAVSAMKEIEHSSNEISQIIGVIDDIAFQTNLLALNAGVEAARAGDAGRGFAVVASEVRALAQRSSDAAKQIKGLIGSSSQQVERGVGLVDKAGAVLTRIVDRISHISTLMTDIASGAEEQSIGLGEINTGVTQLDKVTQQNAAMVEETTAGYHKLNRDAQSLSEMVAKFKLSQAAAVVPATIQKTPVIPAENVMVFNSPRAKTAKQRTKMPKPIPTPRLAATGSDKPKPASTDDMWENF